MPRHDVCLRLVRHGETDWNVEGRIQGHLDIPLNARGREQAAALADTLAGSGARLVVTSDLRRARETADIVAGRLGVPVRTEPLLRERNLGVLQGRTAADLAGDGEHGPSFVARMINDPSSHPDGGESLVAFRARIATAVRSLVDDPPADDIVVVSHGGAVRAALLALVGTDHRDVVPRIGNCSVSRVLVADGVASIVDETVPPTDEAHAVDESLAS